MRRLDEAMRGIASDGGVVIVQLARNHPHDLAGCALDITDAPIGDAEIASLILLELGVSRVPLLLHVARSTEQPPSASTLSTSSPYGERYALEPVTSLAHPRRSTPYLIGYQSVNNQRSSANSGLTCSPMRDGGLTGHAFCQDNTAGTLAKLSGLRLLPGLLKVRMSARAKIVCRQPDRG